MSDLLARVTSLASTLPSRRRDIDRARTLPDDVVRALLELDVMRALAPRDLGAPELSPSEVIDVIETLARGDAAVGWVTMVGSTTSVAAAYLPEAGAREIFGSAGELACGVFAPSGRAVEVDGGVKVSGRWPFASGSAHARHVLGGFLLERGEARVMMQGFFTRDQLEIVDTWDTVGLRGTGSNDFVAKDAFVPSHRLLTLTAPPRAPGLVYRFPLFGLLALGVSAVATGIARSALDEVRALAATKRPQGGKRTLAEREAVQSDVARAEMELAAARALVRETVRDLEARAARDSMTSTDRALLRAAATHATQASARVVDLAHRIAGSTSIFEVSPLAQHFRDVHVATQHVMVAEPVYALAGRVMLGLPTDGTLL